MKKIVFGIKHGINLDGDLSEVIKRLQKVELDNSEFAPLVLDVEAEECYGCPSLSISLSGIRKETKDEARTRIDKSKTAKQKQLDQKRVQFERLKRELGEA